MRTNKINDHSIFFFFFHFLANQHVFAHNNPPDSSCCTSVCTRAVSYGMYKSFKSEKQRMLSCTTRLHDGNRGQCHEFTVRRWNVTYSHFKEFQKEDDRSLWPNPLYTRECKCNANFGGYDCGDCEFGYHGTNCDQKTILKRKNFQTMSDEEKDRYMRYVNMSRYESELS